MGVPLGQQFRIGLYLLARRLRGERRYPLVLMLEPLFRCNLACAGCGKIDYPPHILDRRLSVSDALAAVDECGAPVVSIAGGEPLLHKQMPEIVRGCIERRRFVYLCTNALLLAKRMDDYRPSRYFTFSVHLDGNEQRHDASVCQPGVFRRAEAAIRQARERGFRVTVNCTLFQGETPQEVADFLDDATALGVEGVTIAPGFGYQHAPRQDVFLGRRKAMQLFREVFRIGRKRRRRWPLNHSSLYLDFLAGNRSYQCTAWGNPTRNVFGWQKPCYLLVGEGHAASYRALLEETDWQAYGVGRNPKCGDCMVHCGFEPTAVEDAVAHPWQALKVALRGPRLDGPMALEPSAHTTAAPADADSAGAHGGRAA